MGNWRNASLRDAEARQRQVFDYPHNRMPHVLLPRISAMLLLCGSALAAEAEFKPLFNGKDLDRLGG